MIGTPFGALAELVGALSRTPSRLEKRRLVASFLLRLNPDEVSPGALLLVGRVFADDDGRSLNVGWASVQHAQDVPRDEAAGELSLGDVAASFEAIAAASGADSQRVRTELLQRLFSRAPDADRDVLLRIVSGEMRTGVSEGVLLDALADAAGVPPAAVRRAHLFVGDLGKLARLALTGGATALAAAALHVLEPIKPMLADLGEDAADVLAEHGGTTAVEYKLDGVRVQIHRDGGQVRIFSRRLSDVTASIPEIAAWARALPAASLLVEGELVAVDARGRPRPFQEVMRRFGRVHDIDAAAQEVPLQLYLFDLLWRDGASFVDAPYRERWAALEKAVPAATLVPRKVTSDAAEIDAFLAEAMAAGHEGLMAKDLEAPYAVGRRGKKWLKLKPAETLDVAILAAEWGHGRRTGTLSNYWLGVREGQTWQMIGKTFKGLTDAERLRVMARLLEAKTSETQWVVQVEPKVVVEVAYNEIQKSPRYASGFSLRFARVTRVRDDKAPSDADTYERLRALFQRQFERKGA